MRVLRAVGCAPIVVTDPLPHRRSAALDAGAAIAAEPGTRDLPPCDVAFEAAGEDAAVADAVEGVRPGGRVVIVGIPAQDTTTFPASAARRKGLTLLVSRRMAATDLSRAVRMAEAAGLSLAPLITERHPLADAPLAFASLVERRGIKVVVEPGA